MGVLLGMTMGALLGMTVGVPGDDNEPHPRDFSGSAFQGDNPGLLVKPLIPYAVAIFASSSRFKRSTASCRSLYFWILPLAVVGYSSTNTK